MQRLEPVMPNRSADSLRRWVKTNRLPIRVDLIEGRIAFNRDEFEAWLESPAALVRTEGE